MKRYPTITGLLICFVATGFWISIKFSSPDGSRSITTTPAKSIHGAMPQVRSSMPEQRLNERIAPKAQPHGNENFAKTIAVPEMLRSADSLIGDERTRLERIATQEVSRYPEDMFVRWAPTIVDNLHRFVEKHEYNGESTYSPKSRVSITPFSGTTVIADNVGFRDDGYALSWTGEITSGGTGTVSIHLITLGEGEQRLGISIYSDVGAFRVNGIVNSSYAVAMELDRNRPLSDM